MDIFTTALVGLIVVLSLIYLSMYVPGAGDFYNRVASGQWFVVGAEREGDVLKIDVTAHHPKPSKDNVSHVEDKHSVAPVDPSGFEKGTTDIPASTKMPEEIVETPEVFLVQDGIYAYDEAEPLCRAYGARLATMGDLYDAWRKGADWCTYGWVKGNKAVYPTQKSSWVKLQESENKQIRTKCGVPGLNGGMIRDHSRRFGVHCYGVKPPTWRNYLANTMASDNLTAVEHEKKTMTSEFRRKLNQYTVAPFSKIRWSDVYKTPNDQDISSV
jgi:hypothetical protein